MSRVFDGAQVDPNKTYLQTSASPAYDNLNEITIAAWIYPTFADLFGVITVKDTVTIYNQSIQFSSHIPAEPRVIEAALGSQAAGIPYSRTIEQVPLNQWTHVTATLSQSGDNLVRIYLNGVEATYAFRSYSSSYGDDDSGGGFSIGHDVVWGDAGGFTGRIAELAIFNRLLTPVEVVALASSTTGAQGIADANRVGYWHLCGMNSPEPDFSGNGNSAVLSSNPPLPGPDSPGFSCTDKTHQINAVIRVDLDKTHQIDSSIFIPLFPIALSAKDIILPPLALLFPGSTFVTEKNCTGFSINFTPAGGSFSISILRGEALIPGKDFVIQMPMGRVGIVKQTTQSLSSGGLVDVISGPMIPLVASQYTFVARQQPFSEFMAILARELTHGIVNWKARDFPIRGFNYRGIALGGVQSLASNILADVIIRDDNILYVVEPDQIVGNNIAISKSEIVSITQVIDYSAVKKAVINPALTLVNLDISSLGSFIYDDEHAQKQGNTQVSCGAPGGTGAQDFIPIPDGWLVEGSYEEWTPASVEDFTNPAGSVPNGRYWKVFPSPSNPGKLRGITSFTKLVKDMKLSGGVSSFVGSPITAQTKTGSTREFILGSQQTESGIAGFTATDTLVLDAISGQAVQVKNALELRPPFGSGNADKNFFSIQMGAWTFPRVAPLIFPGAGVDPTNPFNVPADTTVVSPPGQIIPSLDYYNYYLAQYNKQNSIKLKTNLSFLFRGTNIPQCGDRLVLETGIVPEADCGKINTVSVGFNRGGIVVQVTAERLAYNTAERLGYSGVS